MSDAEAGQGRRHVVPGVVGRARSERSGAARTLGKVIGSASVIGGLVGAAALGGVTAQRRALRRFRELGGLSDAGFDALTVDREYSVAAADGVALHVEEIGPAGAPLTVIFSHGWTLRLGAWHFQRVGLAGPDFGAGQIAGSGRAGDEVAVPGRSGGGSAGDAPDARPSARSRADTRSRRADSPSPTSRDDPADPGPQARLVFYDQRSHGRSSRAPAGHSGIADLAADLAAVIATAAPDGPLVLVGHSMGGMALLALAGQDPDLFARRVAGVALLSTSGSEANADRGRWIQINGANPLLPVVAAAAARYPGAFERGRLAGRDVLWMMTRALGFADPKVPAPLVDYLDQMISAVPMDVIAEFAPALFSHDQMAALPALSGIPTLIAVGEQDRMTPPSRSRALADALPGAELLEIPGAGHMAIMEAPDVINDGLRELLRRAWRRAGDAGAAAVGGA